MILSAASAAVFGDDGGPNKSGYTLFDPTPDAELRSFNTDRPPRRIVVAKATGMIAQYFVRSAAMQKVVSERCVASIRLPELPREMIARLSSEGTKRTPGTSLLLMDYFRARNGLRENLVNAGAVH